MISSMCACKVASLDQGAGGRPPPGRGGGVTGDAGCLPMRRMAVPPSSIGSVSDTPTGFIVFFFIAVDGSVRSVEDSVDDSVRLWIRFGFGFGSVVDSK